MPKKKQETSTKPAPSKKTTKRSASASATKKAAPEPKAEKKPAKSTGRTNKRHETIPDTKVLALFAGTKPHLTKKELVDGCGGDEIAVTKAVNKLRGEGKIVATGNSRNTVYSKAA